MSKSIKLKDNTYWDSSSIVHGNTSLSTMINGLGGNTYTGLSKARRIDNCNLNELVGYGSGMYVAFATCQNAPYNNGVNNWHWYVIQVVYAHDYCCQIAMSLHTETKVFARQKIAGGWNDWKALAFA